MVNLVLNFKNNNKILIALTSVVIVISLFYLGKCIHKVDETVTQIVEENPVLNTISNAVESIPNPIVNLISKPKPKPAGQGSTASEPVVDSAYGTPIEFVYKFRFDPHFDAGVYSSVIPPSKDYIIPKPGIGVTLFSKGMNAKLNKWRFVRIGVGGWPTTGLDVTFSPVMYNLGTKLPIITNTYVYPYAGYNIHNNKAIAGLGISLSF